MMVEGRVLKPKGKDKYWSVEIPHLAIYTQGKNEKDAYRMAAEAVTALAESKEIEVKVVAEKGGRFYVDGGDSAEFLAFVLKRLRMAHNVKLLEAAEKLGSKSPNAFGRYEQGLAAPSVAKMEELIQAIDPKLHLVLKEA